MSGTSLDGLDVAYCEFEFKKSWRFKLLSGKMFPYSAKWKEKLSNAHHLPGEFLMNLHGEYGRLMGKCCLQFMRQHSVRHVDLVASHGHTIFHQPEKRFTFQLGDGASLHATTGLPVVFDFRTLDVALGGQGAPLVPVGDKLLFSPYDVCLNLGGIANLSMDIKGKRKAFDICFCNMALNYLMMSINRSFDRDGKLASSGSINTPMLKACTRLYSSYRKTRPSLAREMFEKQWKPLLDDARVPLADRLCTVCESVAREIVRSIPSTKKRVKMLATGGGAFNAFLINLLIEKLKDRAEVIVPPQSIIEFKEALIFAFLGVLRVRNEVNVLKSVTSACRDSCSGTLVGVHLQIRAE